MPDILRKRSFSLAGHRTSVALEPPFWTVLEQLAASRALSLAGLMSQLDNERGERPLASTARLAALDHALTRARTPETDAQLSSDHHGAVIGKG